MTKARKKHSNARQAWVTGTSYDAPRKLCAYEASLRDLGLQAASLEELLVNPELVAWVTRNRHERFCPELLLHKLGHTTIWHGGKSRKHHISYADVRVELEESTKSPEISTR
jgi:hypothetical protein